MKYFVMDSVAAEVHERSIDPTRLAGLPLAQQIAMLYAFDGVNCDGEDWFDAINENIEYDSDGETGQLMVETGRGHNYAIVFNQNDPQAALKTAKALLNEELGSDEDEDED